MLCIDCQERDGTTPKAKRCNNCYVKNYRKNHPGYENGLKYNGNGVKVLERDGHKCVKCGSTRNTHIHHIDGNGSNLKDCQQNNSLDNLMTICSKCHVTFHSNRLKPGLWSRKYSKCLTCLSAKIPYGGKGQCKICYGQKRRDLGLVKKTVRKPGYFKKWPSYQARQRIKIKTLHIN